MFNKFINTKKWAAYSYWIYMIANSKPKSFVKLSGE